MKKNTNVVYNGKVGAKMKPKKSTSSKATPKRMFESLDGPLKGHSLCLQEDGGTLPITIKGVSGHYSRGVGSLICWVPASVTVELAPCLN